MGGSNLSNQASFPKTKVLSSRMYHMLDHKTSLNKFKKTEIISRFFSNHNTMRLDIKEKNMESTNIWKLPMGY